MVLRSAGAVRAVEVEAWARQLVERVLAGAPQEDSRVDFEASPPSPEHSARQIAGHCNAARGASVLWLLGVDENGHAVPGA